MTPLPYAWVDKIFNRLHGIYGNAFTNKFANFNMVDGKDAGIENAKEVWGEELAGFHNMPDAIGKALQNVKGEKAPNAKEFADLCREAAKVIRDDQKKLPDLTPADPAKRDAALRAASSVVRAGKDDHRHWARVLRESYLAGEPLLAIQQRFASEALGEVWRDGKCVEKAANEMGAH